MIDRWRMNDAFVTDRDTYADRDRSVSGVIVRQPLVVADHFVDDEAQEFLREFRIELRIRRPLPSGACLSSGKGGS